MRCCSRTICLATFESTENERSFPFRPIEFSLLISFGSTGELPIWTQIDDDR